MKVHQLTIVCLSPHDLTNSTKFKTLHIWNYTYQAQLHLLHALASRIHYCSVLMQISLSVGLYSVSALLVTPSGSSAFRSGDKTDRRKIRWRMSKPLLLGQPRTRKTFYHVACSRHASRIHLHVVPAHLTAAIFFGFHFKNKFGMQRGVWHTLLVFGILFSGLTSGSSITSFEAPAISDDVMKWRNETS